MDVRHIYGNVNANGSIRSGSGDFSAVAEGNNGVYTVIFTPPFKNIPTVVATQNFPVWDDLGSDGGDTRDNATVIAVTTNRAKIKTGNSNGAGIDRNFGFVAVG